MIVCMGFPEIVTIEVDERGRTTLGRVRPGRYSVTVQPDGSVLLQPGRFITDQQMLLMARSDILEVIAEGESRQAQAQTRRPHPRRPMKIREFQEQDREAVIALWKACDLTRPWNNPELDIDRKLADSPWGLLVLTDEDETVIGSVMLGYDGHRGWINYLAAAPTRRREGIASKLMARAEQILLERGCPKVNLQVRLGNDDAAAFYMQRGYQNDKVTSYGFRLDT